MLILGGNQLAGGYNVDNSLRFNNPSDDSLTRTQTAGNRKTYTFSVWIKRAKLGAYLNIMGTNSEGEALRLESNNSLAYFFNGASSGILTTTQVFRDVSSWYHIVVAVDTSQATASNRLKIYVNGQQITSFSPATYPSLNQENKINQSGQTFHIGNGHAEGAGREFDGYMAEAVMIDGQQLTPTSFGEFDEDSGIWKPIDGLADDLTFGTNGFYLDFENSGSLGADVSGNGNNFTVNNLTAIDQTTDTPTNNFCTLNPLQSNTVRDSVNAPTNGNLTFNDTNNADWRTVIGSLGISSGKWYWEVKATTLSAGVGLSGVGRQNYLPTTLNQTTNAFTGFYSGDLSFGYRSSGIYYSNGTSSSGKTTFTTGDIVMIALDMDNGAIYTGKNGTWNDSGDPTSGASKTGASYTGIQTGEFYSPSVSATSSNAQLDHNFGNPPFTISSGNADGNGYGNFEYAVPSGYYSLNTKNLAQYG